MTWEEPHNYFKAHTEDGYWTSFKDYLRYTEMMKQAECMTPIFQFFKIKGVRYMAITYGSGDIIDIGEL